MSLRSTEHFPSSNDPPYHREEKITDQDYGDVVHIVGLDGHDGGKTEEYGGEDGPENTRSSILCLEDKVRGRDGYKREM